MTVKVVCVIFILLPATVFCATLGSTCTTPNGEAAICKEVRDCKVILDGVLSRDKNALEFAKQSGCGFNKQQPLVCCGSTAKFTQQVGSTNLSPLLPDKSTCGLTKGFRVVGGEITQIWEHPWMALLRYKNKDGTDAGFKCGGTVINKRYVLTAAHCVAISSREEFSLDSVRLGEWRISTDEDCEEDLANEECADPVVDLQIQERIIHRQYERRTTKNDIALLRLERNVKFTDYIRPICLPLPDSSIPEVGTKLVVVGWGATEDVLGSTSDDKLKVEVPIVSLNDCTTKLRNRGRGVSDNQICAGGVSRKDACTGDSGGPLMGTFKKQPNEKDQWYQEGVVSWGVGCGNKGFPAIYTRVSRYMGWLVDNLKE